MRPPSKKAVAKRKQVQRDLTRTIISLPNPQKQWLEEVAKREGVAMTAVVRDAVTHYQQHLAAPLDDFSALGSRLQGTWKRGDGLTWQTQMRDEW